MTRTLIVAILLSASTAVAQREEAYPTAQIKLITSGKMNVLAASTLVRLKTHPNVPTVAELGFPGFDLAATMGLFGRGGTPAAIVERLQAAAAKAMREPDLVQRIEAVGMVIREDGTPHYERMIRDERALYAKLVRDLK
jgi:tripartite-type tricarboxylate transporter receptor subunit TctC